MSFYIDNRITVDRKQYKKLLNRVKYLECQVRHLSKHNERLWKRVRKLEGK